MENKKVLIIGDLHGSPEWEELVNDNLKYYDLFIFLGDYVDSFVISPTEQLHNLKKLIEAAKSNNKIVLLLGNHDYAYIHDYFYTSGFKSEVALEFKRLFEENRDLFNLAWGYTSPNDNKYTLITHAGLTYEYWKNVIAPEYRNGGFIKKFYKTQEEYKALEKHEILNLLKDKRDLMWSIGSKRGGWNHPGPLWADYSELINDPYPEINQIVGHTSQDNITIQFKNDCLYACVDLKNKDDKQFVSSLSIIL